MKRKTGVFIKYILVTALLPAAMQWSACTKTYSTATDKSLDPQRSSQSLLDYLKNNYAFSMFYAGLQKTGLDKQIDSNGKFTLLLPDNDAFARINITRDSLLGMDTAYLRKWLGFHILFGDIGYDSIPQTVDNVFYSILGQKIYLSKPLVPSPNGPRVLHVNGTDVNSFDISASNGYIQVLNTPLNAPLEGNLQDFIDAHLDQFSLFKASLKKFDLWDRLRTDTGKPLTVFAPVNDAFQKLRVRYPGGIRYVLYSITEDSIATWDTSVMPTDVFGVYLFPGRIFTSDFSDAPAGPAFASYIMPDQQVVVNFDSYGLGVRMLSNYNSRLKKPRDNFPATIISPGNYMTVNGNNVIQPINALLMIP
ncbi:MAG: fasciclin domain-containing protein [Chitinophagaceae bacterium]|nr:fasciclin domain-containing protein [Chitinophagaceae bacterium]